VDVKALIKVGYRCNNHCTFCHTLEARGVEASTEEVLRNIDRAARLGHTMVVFSGGEATMRPELLRWAARANALGLDLGLVTNGRMLAYPRLVDALLARRLRYVYLSLHGGTPEVHDSMVRAAAFDQTFAAVKNLAGRGLDLTVNAVVTQQNQRHLRGLVDAMLPHPDVTLKLSMVEPKGGADQLFGQIVPRVSDAAASVRDAIEYGLARSGGAARYAHDGIPLCLLPGHERLYDDLRTHRFATMIEVGERDFFPVDARAHVQPEACRPCALRGPCPGLYRGYRDVHGDGEIRPLLGPPRSNSFHYVLEAHAGAVRDGRCPVREDGVSPWDRARHLFLRSGEEVDRYRTGSRDFADVEIETTKIGLGQIYLDMSAKVAVDDFAGDLAPLRRSALCAACPEDGACAGMYEAAAVDVFGRDDRRVREILADLTGDILDVGCGEGRYGEILEPIVRAGRMRYVGREPSAELVASLGARWPWARVEVGEAESIGAREAFDHVLVLRSWNHLHDPERALAAIVRALRPCGTLTVVDNVAFGLVRSREQAARAEGGAARFEHYRNDDATWPDDVARRLGLAPLERRDVGPGTSNQWLLRFRRDG
jgi:pyruvate-formate lyase-activating enzyme/SAM-dependent methyltransferase